MRKWFRKIALIALLALVAGFVLYDRFWRPAPVEAIEIQPMTLAIEVSGTGRLDAHLSAAVSTKIQGRIEQIEFDQGDAVQAGQVICRLDDDDLQRQVEISEAGVEVARAAISRAEAELTRADAALALAEREAQRIRDAAERSAVSASELDRVVQQAAIAAADARRAEAALLEARQQLVVAEGTLDLRRSQLDETVIVSPFDGIIARRDRDPGDVVVPGSSIVLLVAPKQLWVSAWVDEIAIASLEAGQLARIVFRSEPDREYAGRVARVGFEVDPETREFLVDVAIDALPPRWAVGQRAEVYITTKLLDDAIAVPGAYLAARAGESGVFVLTDDRASWRPCEIGARTRDRVEILSGVEAGDRVARPLDDAPPLRPGQRVTVQ